MLHCVCDRCNNVYAVRAPLWPGKALCPRCDFAARVWERNQYTKEQAAA